ncbi:MAG: DUF4861 domain-containing protein [Bacteroidales bacterium]|nr:DUF4861 domain-containing protein [Bacteroidales bacterium]MBO7232202.1 DUF4861 domain-containing protein [Bacteroidales bacterium]
MKKISLLALAALMMSACCCKDKTVTVNVTNESDLVRKSENVELCLGKLQAALKAGEDAQFVVYNPEGQEIPSQIVSDCKDAKKLLFQVDLDANASAVYSIKVGTPQAYPTQAQTTFMPRRKDDISWENDRSIFRMYGPALATDKTEPLISGGLDIWVKRTPKLVSQQWYQDEFDGKSSYHHDNGEGLDFYSVGKTLGAGGVAPFIDGKLYLVGNNFHTYTILENGPIRTKFRLDYAAYDVAGNPISESRIITLDAGSHLNKVVVLYDNKEDMCVAAGFPFRGFAEKAKTKVDKRGIADCQDIVFNKEAGWIAYGEPNHPENGIIFLGSIMPCGACDMLIAENHVLNCGKAIAGKPFVYYSGGAWSKGGFENIQAWSQYMADYAAKLKQPIKVCTSYCDHQEVACEKESTCEKAPKAACEKACIK